MGLFDFLKNKDNNDKPDNKNSGSSDTNQKYSGDLDKTEIIIRLCNVPKHKRDSAWQDELLKNVAGASFQSGKPQTMTGPDGMHYFQLVLPEPNIPFESFVIEPMIKEFLLEDGLGVVINANKPEPDWVFSYGDIVNYSIRREFLTTNTMFSDKKSREEILEKQERIRVGQPSETIIPLATRKVVRAYLGTFGLVPKVCLMEWVDRDSRFDIVFNIVPDMFEKREHFQIIMGSVKWFLPRHYSIVCKNEDDQFQPL